MLVGCWWGVTRSIHGMIKELKHLDDLTEVRHADHPAAFAVFAGIKAHPGYKLVSIFRNNWSDKGFFYSFESSRLVLTTRQRTQPPQMQESTIRQSFKKNNHDTQIQILSYQYRVGYEVRPSLWRMKVLTHRTRAIIWYNFGGAKIRFRAVFMKHSSVSRV